MGKSIVEFFSHAGDNYAVGNIKVGNGIGEVKSEGVKTEIKSDAVYDLNGRRVSEPAMTFWASPWSPPQWMKTNKHYAQGIYIINGEKMSAE